MEDLFIEETPTTPEVNFEFQKGEFEIKGVSIPEDTEEFYTPLLEKMEEYIREEQPPQMVMNFRLIYVNTSTTAVLGKFIKLLEPEEESRKVQINWYYETEDDDMKDLGEDFKTFTKTDFELIACDEIE